MRRKNRNVSSVLISTVSYSCGSTKTLINRSHRYLAQSVMIIVMAAKVKKLAARRTPALVVLRVPEVPLAPDVADVASVGADVDLADVSVVADVGNCVQTCAVFVQHVGASVVMKEEKVTFIPELSASAAHAVTEGEKSDIMPTMKKQGRPPKPASARGLHLALSTHMLNTNAEQM